MRAHDDEYFDSITIADDMMFRDVFGKDEELARQLLETVLERPIGEVERLYQATEMRSEAGERAVWLDVYLRAKNGEMGNVEMQRYRERSLPLRLRAHLSAMDRDAWSRGDKFKDLKHATTVFICTYDPIGAGLRKYVAHRHLEELDACLVDGQEVVLLNAKGTDGEVSQRLALFLRYVAGYHGEDVMADRFVCAVDSRVRRLGQDSNWREGFMSVQQMIEHECEESRARGLAEGLAEGRAKGLAEGRAEGLAEGRLSFRVESVRHIVECQGFTPECALSFIGVPESEWPSVLAAL